MSAVSQAFEDLGYPDAREIAATLNSRVYRAREVSSGREVVLKVINDDEAGQRELRYHTRLAGARHIVHIIRSHIRGPDLILVLESYHKGLPDLKPMVEPILLLTSARDTAKGLLEMSDAAIINTDVKIENMLAWVDNRETRFVHCDFGGCCDESDRRASFYTERYAPPEVLEGRPSSRSPVFLWAVAMENLLGASGSTIEGVNVATRLPWVGQAFGEILLQCIQPETTSRPTVVELGRLVDEWVRKRRRCAACGRHVLWGGRCMSGCS